MTNTTNPADLEAARLLLSRLGVNPADLLTETPADNDTAQEPVPTISEWIPVVADLVSPSTASSYGSYWKKAEAAWPGRRMDTITASDIKAQAEIVRRTARVRRNSRGGRNAAENFVAAIRCLYKHLVNDRRMDERDNPAMRVTKPRRNPSTRRGLANARLTELSDVVASTGNDPELDALICRLHVETACRRGGALAAAAPRPRRKAMPGLTAGEGRDRTLAAGFTHADASPPRACRGTRRRRPERAAAALRRRQTHH